MEDGEPRVRREYVVDYGDELGYGVCRVTTSGSWEPVRIRQGDAFTPLRFESSDHAYAFAAAMSVGDAVEFEPCDDED